MAKFLNTSATTYILEQLINKARKRVILISPYLKFNKRIKQQIEDRTSQGIQFDIVYGKSDLKSSEKSWLHSIDSINLYFCNDLHAKCYLNETSCIITSMNLYEFSQVNNDEMGVLLTASADKDAFSDTAKEALRLIRIAEKQEAQVKKLPPTEALRPSLKSQPKKTKSTTDKTEFEKITTSALAKKHKLKTTRLIHALKSNGFIFEENGLNKLTDKGKEIGGEFRKGSSGYYFIWPKDLNLNRAISD